MAATTVATCNIVAKTSAVAGNKPSLSLKAAPSVQREWRAKTVSNGIKTRQMLVWQPFNNKCVLCSRVPCVGSGRGLCAWLTVRVCACGVFAAVLAALLGTAVAI